MKNELTSSCISVRDLNFGYEDKSSVLNDLCLCIENGERVGIAGPNGAGKTTLFHLLCGLLKQGTGTVQIKGKDVAYKKFNPELGYVFQNPDNQLFNATVYDDVGFGPLNQGLSRQEVDKAVNDALKRTATSHLRDRSPHHLSEGEKRMVAIATVIAMRPEIMIYDEPTSFLDLRARRRLIQFMNSKVQTLLCASHDLEFILETCNRLIVLDKGVLVADGDPASVMSDEVFMRKHGLERPHSLLHGTDHNH